MLLLASVYVGLLQWTYVHDIHPRWAYMGLEHHEPGAWLRLALSLVAVAPVAWMPRTLVRPSQIGLWFIYLLVYVPSLLIPADAIGGAPWRWLSIGLVLSLCMLLLSWSYAIPLSPAPRRDPPEAVPRFWLAIGGLGVALYAVVLSHFGLPTTLPTLLEIYDVRADFGDAVRGGGRLSAYAVSWTANVINPLLVAWGLSRRRWWVAALGVAGQLVLFGITGLKSVLLSAGLIVAVVVVLRGDGRRFGVWMLGGATVVLVLGVIESQLFDGGLLSGVLVRRTFVVPGQLMGLFVDYYGQHEKAWLGHSILGGIVPYGTELAPPRLVGGRYFASVASANASVWADGYANFGELGMVAATGLLAAVFRLYDRAAVGLRRALATGLFAIPALTLANSALLTSLLTHGVLLVIAVVMLLPRVDRRAEGTA